MYALLRDGSSGFGVSSKSQFRMASDSTHKSHSDERPRTVHAGRPDGLTTTNNTNNDNNDNDTNYNTNSIKCY